MPSKVSTLFFAKEIKTPPLVMLQDGGGEDVPRGRIEEGIYSGFNKPAIFRPKTQKISAAQVLPAEPQFLIALRPLILAALIFSYALCCQTLIIATSAGT